MLRYCLALDICGDDLDPGGDGGYVGVVGSTEGATCLLLAVALLAVFHVLSVLSLSFL